MKSSPKPANRWIALVLLIFMATLAPAQAQAQQTFHVSNASELSDALSQAFNNLVSNGSTTDTINIHYGGADPITGVVASGAAHGALLEV